jgi:hypothetical protein
VGEPTPEEMTAEQLIEQIRRIKVTDMLLSSMSTIAQLGFAKLERGSRDLAEAKLAVETLRALVPVLEGSLDEEIVRDFRQVVADLQLAYADAAGEAEG